MSVADALIMIFVVPFSLYDTLTGYWPFGEVRLFLLYILYFYSCLFIIVIWLILIYLSLFISSIYLYLSIFTSSYNLHIIRILNIHNGTLLHIPCVECFILFYFIILHFHPFLQVYCYIYRALDVSLCTASIWNILIIGLDRYVSVKYPITFRKFRTDSRITCGIASVS